MNTMVSFLCPLMAVSNQRTLSPKDAAQPMAPLMEDAQRFRIDFGLLRYFQGVINGDAFLLS
jgi:hypothetical protein